jgi:hypothetical protein
MNEKSNEKEMNHEDSKVWMKEEGKRARSADSYTFFFLQFLCLDGLGSQ